MITKDNFYKETHTTWNEITSIPNRDPDYISYRKPREKYIYIDTIDGKNVTIDNCTISESDILWTIKRREVREKMVWKGGRYTKIESDVYIVEELITKTESSFYWFTEDGVIRKSDHWGIVGDCLWHLKTINNRKIAWFSKKITRIGFAEWEDIIDRRKIKKSQTIDNQSNGI